MTITPELLAQLFTTFGPFGAMGIVMWVTRKPAESSAGSSVSELVREITAIRERLAAIEAILEERK